jgi:hypothetical protein
LVNVFSSTALTALWFQHSEMKPRFHHLLPVQCDWKVYRHLCGKGLKSQSRSHSFRFMNIFEHFLNPSCAKLTIAQPNCDNLVENSAWKLWKCTRKFWSCEIVFH